jgi:hypothetical protein
MACPVQFLNWNGTGARGDNRRNLVVPTQAKHEESIMTTRKIFCLLALPAFLLCGEAAAGGNKGGGAPKQAASATAKISTITVRKAGKGQQEYLRGVASPAAKSSMAKQTTGTAAASGRQPNKVGGSCPPWACGSDSNGPQLTGIQGEPVQQLDKLATNGTQLSGLQAANGLIAISAVTLASGEAMALR